jgi:hypothetical protein
MGKTVNFLFLILFLFNTLFSMDSSQVQKSPVEVNPAPYLISSALVPGLGQFLLGHKVKGPALLATETVLLLSGINDGFYLTGKWEDKVSVIEARLKQPFEDSLALIDSLEEYKGELRYSLAIRNRTIAWAVGFHVFNFLDCYHYLSRSKKPRVHESSPKGALLRSLLVPGWGQFYNREYAKLGLLLMAVAGLGSNITVWQKTADYFNDLEHKYRDLSDKLLPRLEAASDSISAVTDELALVRNRLADTTLTLTLEERDQLNDQENALITEKNSLEHEKTALAQDNNYYLVRNTKYGSERKKYLSRRNQNVWYLFAVYLYAAFDAYVDAHLNRLNQRLDFTLTAAPEELRFSCQYQF